MKCNIISTGSSGNAVVINDSILIDCGVSFKSLAEVKQDLKLVLLTHVHSDHFNPNTVRSLSRERPTLRWGCCEWMVQPLLEAGVDKRCIDVMDNEIFSCYMGFVSVAPVNLVHDVPNCGWRLFTDRRILYATDTATLDHIEAAGYDLYLIEANHRKAEIEARAAEKIARGEFAYERRAAATHLSEEKALDWLAQNMGANSKYIFLHQHKEKNDESH